MAPTGLRREGEGARRNAADTPVDAGATHPVDALPRDGRETSSSATGREFFCSFCWDAGVAGGVWQEAEEALEREEGEAAKKSSSSKPPFSDEEIMESEDSVREEETVFEPVAVVVAGF